MKMTLTNLSAAVLCVLTAACTGDSHDDTARSSRIADSTARAGGTRGADTRATTAGFASARSFVGRRYDTLPKGFSSVEGAVIPAGATGGSYAFSHVRTPRGDMIWLDSLANGGGEHAERVVRAELMVPPMAADERIVMASCDSGGKLDPRVVAIVVARAGATRFTDVRQAWRVNVAEGRFDVIPVAGVSCEEPGS